MRCSHRHLPVLSSAASFPSRGGGVALGGYGAVGDGVPYFSLGSAGGAITFSLGSAGGAIKGLGINGQGHGGEQGQGGQEGRQTAAQGAGGGAVLRHLLTSFLFLSVALCL